MARPVDLGVAELLKPVENLEGKSPPPKKRKKVEFSVEEQKIEKFENSSPPRMVP